MVFFLLACNPNIEIAEDTEPVFNETKTPTVKITSTVIPTLTNLTTPTISPTATRTITITRTITSTKTLTITAPFEKGDYFRLEAMDLSLFSSERLKVYGFHTENSIFEVGENSYKMEDMFSLFTEIRFSENDQSTTRFAICKGDFFDKPE